MKWQELSIGPFKPTKVNGKSVPWVVVFVIHEHGRVVIKGMENAVDTMIKQRFPKSIFKKITYIHMKGEPPRVMDSGYWTSHSLHIRASRESKQYPHKNDGKYYKPSRPTKRFVYTLRVKQQSGGYVCITFRDFPKHWLPVYDTAAPIMPRQHAGYLV